MRDYRFHVTSLMAVFLALGIGIFIGYGMALSIGMDPLRLQIDAIRKHDVNVEDDNKDLRGDNAQLRQAQLSLRREKERLASLSIRGRLAGRTVSLVCVGPLPGPGLVDSVWRALIQAGARRLNETIIHGSLAPQNPDDLQEIMERVHAAPSQPPADAITAALGQTIGSGIDPTLPDALSHRGVAIDPSGTYGVRPDLVILLCQINSHDRLSALERGDTPETPLVQSFMAQNIRVVECEPSTTTDTASSYFRRLGVSSVDDIETVEGQVAMVWAGLGSTGHFGVRNGADSALPPGISDS